VVTFRSAGGGAFVAGTDIEQFSSFGSGEEGVAYAQQIEQCIQTFEVLRMPTVAVIKVLAICGRLAITTACDFRMATPASRFGVPIARTLGKTACLWPTWLG
jgi:enoyl-CoA hydratase